MREQRRILPTFDEWGILPKGHRGPYDNPWAAEPEQMDMSSEPDKAEGSVEARPREAPTPREASRAPQGLYRLKRTSR